MSYVVQCKTCKAGAVIEDPTDPHPAVQCECCPEDHNHGQAASACPRGHDAEPCPEPDAASCPVDGIGRGDSPEQACQGGHCAKGVKGCTVCRPVTITAVGPAAALLLAES